MEKKCDNNDVSKEDKTDTSLESKEKSPLA